MGGLSSVSPLVEPETTPHSIAEQHHSVEFGVGIRGRMPGRLCRKHPPQASALDRTERSTAFSRTTKRSGTVPDPDCVAVKHPVGGACLRGLVTLLPFSELLLFPWALHVSLRHPVHRAYSVWLWLSPSTSCDPGDLVRLQGWWCWRAQSPSARGAQHVAVEGVVHAESAVVCGLSRRNTEWPDGRPPFSIKLPGPRAPGTHSEG